MSQSHHGGDNTFFGMFSELRARPGVELHPALLCLLPLGPSEGAGDPQVEERLEAEVFLCNSHWLISKHRALLQPVVLWRDWYGGLPKPGVEGLYCSCAFCREGELSEFTCACLL